MEKKCTACGSNNLRLVYGLVKEGLGDGAAYLNGKSYVCMECGHIEIYSDDLLALAKQEKEKEDNINALIKQVKTEGKEAEKKIPLLNEKLARLEKDLRNLEEKSKNEDITVKVQKDLLAKIDNIKNQIKETQSEINHANDTIRNVNNRINRIREKGRL